MKEKGFTLIEVLMTMAVFTIFFAMVVIVQNTGIRSAISTVDRSELTIKSLNALDALKKEITSTNMNVGEFQLLNCDIENCDTLRYKVPVADLSPIANTYYDPEGRVKYGADEKQNCYYEIFLSNGDIVRKTVCGYMLCDFDGLCNEGIENTANCPSDCCEDSGTCGDGICDDLCGESEINCCQDCPRSEPINGDGLCCPEASETCINEPACCGEAKVLDNTIFKFIFGSYAYAQEADNIKKLIEGNIVDLGFSCVDQDGNIDPDCSEGILETTVTLEKGNQVINQSFREYLKNKSDTATVDQCNYNGSCELGESNETCPDDCTCGTGDLESNPCLPGESCEMGCFECCQCGDGVCTPEVGENCGNCYDDCNLDCSCGDGWCTESIGEDCESCFSDCSSLCYCGDGICSSNETCDTCESDCGGCGGGGGGKPPHIDD